MLRNILSIPSFSELLSWRVLDFVKTFSCIYWEVHEIFVLASVYMLYYVYGFMYVEPSLHP
jgi:hypothetical protein